MFWDYAENIFQLMANLVAMLMCLFYYITNKHRAWLYGLLFFVSGMLSSYYWVSYQVIMGSWPDSFTLLTYSGWCLAFFFLFILVLRMAIPETRRFFHPLMLLPFPLDIALILFYYNSSPDTPGPVSFRFSQYLTGIYLIVICNVIVVLCLQRMAWYWKNRKKEQVVRPWISLAAFLIVLFEFGMLITSDQAGPVSNLYYPSSFLSSLSFLFLVWAIKRSVVPREKEPLAPFEKKLQNILKASSLGIVLFFSFGGLGLGLWIRNTIMRHIGSASASSVYDIIPIVLYVISVILIIFVVAVILIVYFSQRAAENGKLREATQIAERSSAAKSEFLAAMSHEIRTPINAVMGMNEIVLRESKQARDNLPENPDDVRGVFSDICGYAGIINNAGKNLLSIINDILDISKIEAGKMEIREDSYMLSSVLNDVCNLISVRAASRDLAFHIAVEDCLPDHLFGDAGRVRQIMLNLLNNAVKYTDRGSVSLSVHAGEDTAFIEGQVISLNIAVLDTGVGIRPEDREKLFSKFERIGLGKSEEVEGSGLGLTIVKNLLDMMGGTIRVDSHYGEGSLFTVIIPQRVESTEPIGNFRERFEKSGETADAPQELFRAPRVRILVVDDTRMNLTVVEGLLKKTGMQIDTALGGEEALRLTLSVPYHVILMDQRMPGMDGIETMRRIRAQETGVNRTTPIICLTADAISGAKQRYLDEGFTDYLSKPIDSKALRKTLLAYLPPDKVILLSGADGQPFPDESGFPVVPAASASDALALLPPQDVDTALGLMHCQQDRELYLSLLSEFAVESPGRMERMESSFTAGAWHEYGILVHSLKSISGTIGATGLSKAAAVLEAAAKQGDEAALHQGHAPLMETYRHIVEILGPFRTDDPSADPADSGVIEFLPEE